jgi:TolB-like protein/Flp pilus assembly protein TadD
MEGESPKPGSTPTGAVFLSYASQDAEAAQRICEALRSAGLEVWFDKSELRGGDVWDRQIREQIHNCRLFIPVISANTEARDEGYFRREWGLATDRTRDMAENRAFLIPVVIDDTPERGASVPDRFHQIQWTRLPGGATPRPFVARVAALLGAPAPITTANKLGPALRTIPNSETRKSRTPVIVLGILGLAATIGGGWLIWRYGGTRSPAMQAANSSLPAGVTEKSIAVLPFVDMSEKHDEEYFADGMAEEVLNLLAQVPDLRVPGRTSSFYFKGKQVTVAEIARTLGVAHVLEGSVRRSGTTIRVTVQLIRADNGYHLWSKSYDRAVEDVLKVQDNIAESVVGALKVSLLGGQPSRSASTVNAEAYRLYLEAHAIRTSALSGTVQQAIDDLRESMRLDPTFALARAELAATIAGDFTSTGVLLYPAALADAHAAAAEAVRLDPQLPLAHISLARLFSQVDWNWDAGETEVKKAIALEPGNAEAYRVAGYLATTRGQFDDAIELLKKAVSLDPLQPWNYIAMGFPVYRKHDYAQAETLYRKAIALSPQEYKLHYVLGAVLLLRGQPAAALAEMEREPDAGFRHCGLALAFDALGRKREAQTEVAIAEKDYNNEKAYWIALIYASRSDADNAFHWLERAAKQKDPGMMWILGDPMLDGLVKDPRYGALLRRINLRL